MAHTVRIFIGTSIISYYKGTFALTFCNDKDTLYMPSKTVEIKNKITTHRLVLEAILSSLQGLNISKCNEPIIISFYSNNDQIAYEFNIEYIKEGNFSEGTQDIEMWKKIVKLIESMDKKVKVKILGTNTVLESVGKVKRSLKRK